MKRFIPLLLLPHSINVMADNGDAGEFNGEYYIPIKNEVPKGFESLVSENELTDIYLNGRYIGSFVSESPVFPDAISEEIKASILKSPNTQGEIFNSSRFIAYRNTHNKQINIWDKQQIQHEKYSNSGPTLRTYLHGLSKQQSNGKNTTYHVDNVFNTGAHDIIVGYSQYNENTDIRSAYYGIENESSYFSIGVLPNNSVDSTLSYGKSLVGTQINFNKKKTAARDPLIVTLSEPANIHILRGEQLLSSEQLSEGEHRIDVSSLPSGTYSVTLRIEYLNGLTEEQTRHLTRNLSYGDPWTIGQVTVGALSDNKIGYKSPDKYTPFVSLDVFGYQSNTISSQARISFDDKEAVFSPTLKLLNDYFSSTTQFKIHDHGDWFYSQKLSSSFYDRSQTYFEITGYDNDGLKNQIISLSHNQPFLYGHFVGSIYRQKNTDGRTNYQLTYQQPINISGLERATLSLSFFHAEESVWQLRFTYGATVSNDLDYRLSASLDRNGHKSQHTFRHQNITDFGSVNSEAYALLNRENHGGYGVKTQFNSNSWGMFDIQAGQTQNHSDPFVNTQLKTSFMINGDGLKMTGSNPFKTGFVIDLSNYKGKYELLLNDRRYTLKGEQKHFIKANPYTSYSATLSNSHSPEIYVVDKTLKRKLRNGELSELKWQIEEVAYLAGQITINNKPISNKLVKTSISQGYTDSNGYVAIEIPKDMKTISIENITCELTHINNNLLTVGETSCKLTNRTN